jgi:hypothetical protein
VTDPSQYDRLVEEVVEETIEYHNGWIGDEDFIKTLDGVVDTLSNLLEYARNSDGFSLNDEVALQVALHILRDQ